MALQQAFSRAAHHSCKRILRATLRWWSWKAAWTSANLEASARLVEESRRHRERRKQQRRFTLGPTAEECELLQVGLQAWRDHVAAFLRVLQRTSRQAARQHGALLLVSLDHWVEAALDAKRAENLRRRRHVRFNLTAPSAQVRATSSDKGQGRRNSLPAPVSSRRAPVSEGQRNRSLASADVSTPRRRMSVGPVGQWAQSTSQWQVAAALSSVASWSQEHAAEEELEKKEDILHLEDHDLSPGRRSNADSPIEESPIDSLRLTDPAKGKSEMPSSPAERKPATRGKLTADTVSVVAGAAVRLLDAGPSGSGTARGSPIEGTGGTSTPSAFDTPVRNTPGSPSRAATVGASKRAAGAEPSVEPQEHLEPVACTATCSHCGNRYMPDSLHCRRCGRRRGLPAPPQEPLAYSPLALPMPLPTAPLPKSTEQPRSQSSSRAVPLHLRQQKEAPGEHQPLLQASEGASRRAAAPTQAQGDILRFFKMRD